MALHTEIPELDREGLRKFGIVTGAIVAVLFGLLIPWLFGLSYPWWPWLIFAVLGIWAIVAPDSLRPVYKVWMKFGLLMSRITTPIVLGIAFFLVFLPVALIMRLFRFDPMSRKIDHDKNSYRVESRQPQKNHMERPF